MVFWRFFTRRVVYEDGLEKRKLKCAINFSAGEGPRRDTPLSSRECFQSRGNDNHMRHKRVGLADSADVKASVKESPQAGNQGLEPGRLPLLRR